MTTYDELLTAVSCTDGREIFDPATGELGGSDPGHRAARR